MTADDLFPRDKFYGSVWDECRAKIEEYANLKAKEAARKAAEYMALKFDLSKTEGENIGLAVKHALDQKKEKE